MSTLSTTFEDGFNHTEASDEVIYALDLLHQEARGIQAGSDGVDAIYAAANNGNEFGAFALGVIARTEVHRYLYPAEDTLPEAEEPDTVFDIEARWRELDMIAANYNRSIGDFRTAYILEER